MDVIRWQPPWPLVKISDVEWVVLRDDPRHPAALIRELPARTQDRYRIVRWAPLSEDRRLFGYFRSLEQADMAVTFMGGEPDVGITRLSLERSPEWGRFERWFWSQASERMLLEMRPQWLTQEAIAHGAETTKGPRPLRRVSGGPFG